MSQYSLNDFVANTSEKDHGEGLFELESDRMLEINLDGMVWTKMGSMVAYNGSIKFHIYYLAPKAYVEVKRI